MLQWSVRWGRVQLRTERSREGDGNGSALQRAPLDRNPTGSQHIAHRREERRMSMKSSMRWVALALLVALVDFPSLAGAVPPGTTKFGKNAIKGLTSDS